MKTKIKKQKAEESTEVPQLEQVFKGKVQRERLIVMLSRYREVQGEEKELKGEKGELSEATRTMLAEKGVKRVAMGTVTAAREQGVKETIIGALLLGQGVDPKIIRKATARTVFEKLVVRDSAKENKEEDE